MALTLCFPIPPAPAMDALNCGARSGQGLANEGQQIMGRKPMDPFARRMIQGSFVYGGVMLLMFAVLTVIYLHTRPRCTDRVVAESTGKHWTDRKSTRLNSSHIPLSRI